MMQSACKRRFFRAARSAVLAMCAGAMLGSCSDGAATPESFRIAVLLDETFADGGQTLQWAADNFNKAGGVAGERPVELQFHLSVFTGQNETEEFKQVAEQVFSDPQVHAVVVGSSERLFSAGSYAVNNEKPVISHTSTAGEVFRAFAGKDYVWRVTTSDIAQISTFVRLARERNANSVALLSGFNLYSSSFFSWFGFFAAEHGYGDGAVEINRFEQDAEGTSCVTPMEEMLAKQPALLFLVPESNAQLRCMLRTHVRYSRGHVNRTELFFADAGYDLGLLEDFGDAIDGVSGFALGSPPATGFDTAYRHRFAADQVPANVANAYDAVLLLAYGFELSAGEGGPALVDAIKRLVGFRGPRVGWDEDGVRAGLDAIRNGRWPDISGATGDLVFMPDVYMELSETTYVYWRVEAGQVVTPRHYDFSPDTAGAREELSDGAAGAFEPAAARAGLKAIIGAVSSGWGNYRHQSDALALYQLLKQRGVSDDQILMFGADDIATAAENPRPGFIRNGSGGENLYVDVTYDYELQDLGVFGLLRMMAGDKDGVANALGRARGEGLPVLESDESTNLLLFFAGHGGDKGMAFGAHEPEDAYGGPLDYLTPRMLRVSLCALQAQQRFRRTLVVIEACHSGVYGVELEKGCDDPDARSWALEVRALEPGDGCGSGGVEVVATPTSAGGAAPVGEAVPYVLCHDLESSVMALADVDELVVGDPVCPGGGAEVVLGLDRDGNGWLSRDEIDNRQPVCNSAAHRPLNGVLLMTASNPHENSLGFAFDPEVAVWTADQVAYQVLRQVEDLRGEKVRNVYRDVSQIVSGSHPMLYNAAAFGDISAVNIDEFFLP